MKTPGRVTLKSIAESLDLSVNTVSRALTGKDGVSEETRALVRAEADRLGYVPDFMARSLVLGAGMTLGLVITNPSNPFYAALISAIEQRSREHGYTLMLMVTEENLDNERRAAEAFLRWRVDGAIVVPMQAGAEHWARVQASGVPIVLVNRDLPELDCDFVGVDYENGTYRATCHLLDAKHTTVHMLEEDLPISSVADRVAGFGRALREYDVPCKDDTILRVPTRRQKASALPWDPTDAYRLAQQMSTDMVAGAAIVVGNDYFALGVYRALVEAGFRIPEEVAVLGHGDHPFSAYMNPPLTSVRPSAVEIGATAVDFLLRRLKGASPDATSARILFEPELVVRGSTRGEGARSFDAEGDAVKSSS